MMKLVMSGALATLALAAFAELKKPSEEDLKLIEKSYRSLTDEEKARRNEALLLRYLLEYGGEMAYPGTPAGTIRIVNEQKRVPSADLQKATKVFTSLMRYDIKVVDADCDATLKIRVVDEPTSPVLLVAPEERWAKVNVAKLGDAKTQPTFLASRARKEIHRAFAFLTAGTTSEMPLFKPLKNVGDLDQFAERGFPVDVVMRAKDYLGNLGVYPYERSSYRALVTEGYDIAPTNDYQRAIYEEVKKKVKFTKKVK